MNKHIVSILCLLLSVAVCSASDLSTYKATYEKEMESIVLGYGMEMSQLGQEYTKALDALLDRVKKAGDLDKSTATMDEIKRFNDEKAMPAKASAVLDIQNLQTAYTKQASICEATKAQKIVFLTAKYDNALEGLQKSLVASDKFDDAKAVQAERKAVMTSENVVSAKALFSDAGKGKKQDEPKKPSLTSSAFFKPKVYADDTRGQTGLTTSNNIYTFDVERTHNKAILKFWASGDIGLDTNGDVSLTTPDGKKHEIYKWSPKTFHKTAASVDSYKDLTPVACDVSELVEDAGTYAVEFKYTHGSVALSILRVELEIK